MRCGIIHRNAAVVGQQQDEEYRRRGEQLRPPKIKGQRCLAVEHGAKGECAPPACATVQIKAETGQNHKGQEHSWLRQGGKGRLAAGAHALKGRPGVQRRNHHGKARHSQQVCCEDEVAGKGEWRGKAAKGQHGQRQQSAGQHNRRRQHKGPAGGRADDLALAQEPEDVKIGLQQRLAAAARHYGLDPADNAGQERSQKQAEQKLRAISKGRVAHEPSPQASRQITVA